MQETQVQPLIWEDPMCHRAAEFMRHNCGACPLEPRSCSCRVHLPQGLQWAATQWVGHSERPCGERATVSGHVVSGPHSEQAAVSRPQWAAMRWAGHSERPRGERPTRWAGPCSEWAHAVSGLTVSMPRSEHATQWAANTVNGPRSEQATQWAGHAVSMPRSEHATQWAGHAVSSPCTATRGEPHSPQPDKSPAAMKTNETNNK